MTNAEKLAKDTKRFAEIFDYTSVTFCDKCPMRDFCGHYVRKDYTEKCSDIARVWLEQEAIDEAPTVDGQEVKHGHFIVEDKECFDAIFAKCSICNHFFSYGRKGVTQIGMMNFCPHCGERMDGEQNADC